MSAAICGSIPDVAPLIRATALAFESPSPASRHAHPDQEGDRQRGQRRPPRPAGEHIQRHIRFLQNFDRLVDRPACGTKDLRCDVAERIGRFLGAAARSSSSFNASSNSPMVELLAIVRTNESGA